MASRVPRLAILPAAAAIFAAGPQALGAEGLLPLESYGVIVERKPFGDLAAYKKRGADDPATAAAAEEAQAAREQQALAGQLDLVAVNITLRGTISVGFVDKSAKPAKSFYLGIGESEGGFTVESADYAAETATISKAGVKVTLKLGSGLVAGSEQADAGTPHATPSQPAGDAPRIRPVAIRRTIGGIPGRGGYRARQSERRRAEDEAEAQRQEDSVARLREATDSAAAKREHDMNYRLLLEGKEPISEIHLTPEEEAELESKGLLPPSSGE
ncbi:MAG: hypothetical protein IKH04_11345 [Kiritimatiellae bacterium]|nr:hypothetical protein [Kiritimatiellia bacterium]